MFIGERPTLDPGHVIEPPPRKIRGLGDLVARGLEAVGVKKRKGCGCQRRQDALNRALPFTREN